MTGRTPAHKLSGNGRRLRGGKALTPDRGGWGRFRNHLLAATGTALLAAAALASLLQPSPGHADPGIDCYEEQLLDIVNQYRLQNGRQPLALSASLSAASDWMSGDMGSRAYLGHTDSLGRDPGTRARDYGYTGGVGENIAAGVSLGEAQAVFDAWRSSAGHKANLLGATYQVIGIGRANVPGSPYGLYWTADFGESPNAAAAATSVMTCGGAVSSVMGDANCDASVGPADALEVLRKVAGIAGKTGCSGNADVDCDGRVTSKDALDILAYVARLQRPAAQGCASIGSTI
ncbi:MAG TPA: CAP domain-containing protein [Dehalococcoidia bacterium]|nr:CAP domain-containing protein [Dehalococcoidia bacterium]